MSTILQTFNRMRINISKTIEIYLAMEILQNGNMMKRYIVPHVIIFDRIVLFGLCISAV
jgi:hypothetical protein